MTCGVYEIVNRVNGKRYVGSSKNIESRWGEHRRAAEKGNHHAIAFRRAWKKYGEDAFLFRIIEECDEEYLIDVEQKHLDSGFDYNSSPTASNCLGVKHSDETKEKVRRATIKRNIENPDMLDRFRYSNLGKPKSEEWRAATSERQIGRVQGPEWCLNMSKARAVLTDDQVSSIVELKRSGYSNMSIVKITGIGLRAVQKICSGTGYKWASNKLTDEEIKSLNGRQKKRAV